MDFDQEYPNKPRLQQIITDKQIYNLILLASNLTLLILFRGGKI